MRKVFFSLIILLSSNSFCQNDGMSNSWSFLGPDKKPLEDKRQSATGIGPVEFIEANKAVPGLLLAGSLNGGLFYTKDGGEQWVNSGSDDWAYSGCSAAAFHPTNENVWFANSVNHNANGGPGSIGHEGGVYRTLNGGLNWSLVADNSAFIGSSYLTVFGMKFNPKNSKQLFVYTSEGLYFSEDCEAQKIKWKRVKNIGGWVYDLEFTSSKAYVSQKQHGKWNLFSFEMKDYDSFDTVSFVNELIDSKTSVTIEPQEENLLVLVNFERKGDELWKLDFSQDSYDLILRDQRVIFGNGNTLAGSPHNSDEVYVGYSTTIKRWQVSTKSEKRIRGGYHVDIEGVCYDPFDTNKVYLATHGGVYVSDTDGQEWVSKSKGLGIAEVEGLAISIADPNVMAIGCFHDGSSLRADFDNSGRYEWKNINGGDGLVPLIPQNDLNVVYTSNQYLGGGMYYSNDSGKTSVNIHAQNNVKTSGWRMTGVLHPENQNMLFFNFEVPNGSGKGNIDVARTDNPPGIKTIERMSNFKVSHGIEAYTIYGIYNSEYHPDVLLIHMIEETKDENGKRKDVHRVWRTDHARDSAKNVIHSWYPLEIPRSDWIGSLTLDPNKGNKMYITYVSGKHGTELSEEDFGLAYLLKYKKSNFVLKREISLTANLAYSKAGRYNFTYDGKGGAFFATRTGVYHGTKKTLKGRGLWESVGSGLPHCEVRGLYYHPAQSILTVGFYGRGVWRYSLPTEY